jgi:hypothetical protein
MASVGQLEQIADHKRRNVYIDNVTPDAFSVQAL